MFPDNKITLQLAKTKCAYLVNYGMAPFVKDQLVKNIVALPFYTVHYNMVQNE